jgi:hypothetical protein
MPVYQLALELVDAPVPEESVTSEPPSSTVIDPGSALDLATDLVAPPPPSPT